MKQLMGTYFSIGNAATQCSDKMRSPDSITVYLYYVVIQEIFKIMASILI